MGDAPMVLADEGRLGQVVMNLIQNAVHAIPLGNAAEHRILVRTGTTATGEAFVEVHDTGVGIDPADLSRIFDAFYTTKPIGIGTGLGLSICHKIVASLRGSIEVESETGRGSCFRVVLPPAPAEADQARAVQEHLERVAGRRLRILVVDDEVEIGRAVQRMLGREHDFEPVTSAQTAHERLSEAHYDVVLCDLLMPETSGMELYLRLASERPALLPRFVFMTAGAVDPGVREFLLSVPNPRVDKPFSAALLRDAIAKAARSFAGG
jgi:CheY-like chemotaxis protein